jgi:Holliday junction DNA helicase RuvA
MIAYVSGRVAHVEPGEAVVEVGGVGLSVQCTPATLAGLRVGATARVATSLVVREDSLTLYGFADDDERTVFELLQTASGVGPKLAQAMLAVHGPDELRRAVATEDLAALQQVSGVGKKGAQRLVLELKDRLGPAPALSVDGAAPAPAATEAWRDQVRDALVGLGWAPRDADAAVAQVAETHLADTQDDQHEPDVPTLLRAALQTLARP